MEISHDGYLPLLLYLLLGRVDVVVAEQVHLSSLGYGATEATPIW